MDPILPDTKYLLDAFFKPSEGIQYHAICVKCKYYLRVIESNQEHMHCTVCNFDTCVKELDDKDFFITMDPSSDICQ